MVTIACGYSDTLYVEIRRAATMTLTKYWKQTEGRQHSTVGTPTRLWAGPVFPKLWSADHRWSSDSALVVLLD
jgi:hypothetical protein